MNQAQKVLAYIKIHGKITVAESSRYLNIHHLPRRIKDLEERGVMIKRADKKVLTDNGKWTTITEYSMPQKAEQLKLNLN